MPDTLSTLPEITVQTADGFVVVAEYTDPRSVVPPRKTSLTYDWYGTQNDALEAYSEYERGEFSGFRPIGIFPVRHGLPFGGAFSPMTIAQMLHSER